MITEYDLKMWYLEEVGISEESLECAIFYDKGYNFYRNAIDKCISDSEIVMLVRYMYNHNVNDTRDMICEDWQQFEEMEIKDVLENNNDSLNIPDLHHFLENQFCIFEVLGGCKNECLKEVEITLLALEKNFYFNEDLAY